VPRPTLIPSTDQVCRTGVILDVETTGLDQQKDQVIDLGMVKFDYMPDGRIVGMSDVFRSFNEPSSPIPRRSPPSPASRTRWLRVNGSTRRRSRLFVANAVIVIAHNAGFDRKFAERYWPVFEKAWGCSATEIEWRKHAFEGSRLGYLLNGAVFFQQAHRAVDDCHALLEISRSNFRR
jgi:DNA polymerase-3 subunit epsilon